ncbi:MAG: MBL fold metallo-hydrolase [Chloroflexota bacterium]
MELLHSVCGPLNTNVYVLGDERTREAIAIDTATPCVEWVAAGLAARDWRLITIVNTHGHWDHVGENKAVAEHTGAQIAIHPADNHYLLDPKPLFAPFPIIPSVPAVELAEGGDVRFGEIRLRVLHTPGHTEGSVCLVHEDDGLLFSGDTLFPGGWGRVDLPNGSPDAMAESIARLAGLDDALRVLPGHGKATTIGDERPWMDLVKRQGRLPF